MRKLPFDQEKRLMQRNFEYNFKKIEEKKTDDNKEEEKKVVCGEKRFYTKRKCLK